MDQIFDTVLVEQAKAGDQQAFAELYSRWYDPVYDFVARMTRNRDEAADIAQDTFLKAMNALGGLQKGASFKSWIFTIARNTTLNRLEKARRTQPLVFAGAGGEAVFLDVVDTFRFGSPEEASEAKAMATFVWEAAAGLDPRQLSILDLHLRKGFDSAEIADVMGVTKNNGSVMLNRLKKAVEDAIGTFITFKDGRRHCDDLDALLSEARIEGMSPEVRKLVDRHVAGCEACEERRKKLVSPLAVFGAFAAVGVALGVKAHTLEQLMRQWPGAAAGGGHVPPPPDGGLGAMPGDESLHRPTFSEKFKIGMGKYVVGGGIAAMLLLGAVLIPASPLSPLDEEGTSAQQAASPGGGGSGLAAAATQTPTKTPAGGQSTASPPPSATPTTPAPGQTPTPTSTPGPGSPTPTGTATPTATATSTTTPTATPTATSTPTPIPCGASISTNIGILNIAPNGSAPFTLLASCNSSAFTISGGDGWATASPSEGIVTFGSPRTIQVTLDASGLSEGAHSTTLLIQGDHNSTSVVVSTNVPGASPSVSVTRVSCFATAPTFAISVDVVDDFRVSSVIVRLVIDGVPTDYALNGPDGAASGTWERNISGVAGISSWTVIATDGVGHTGTASGSC